MLYGRMAVVFSILMLLKYLGVNCDVLACNVLDMIHELTQADKSRLKLNMDSGN